MQNTAILQATLSSEFLHMGDRFLRQRWLGILMIPFTALCILIFTENRRTENRVRERSLLQCRETFSPSEMIPSSLIAGVLAQEDFRFFSHSGVDWREVMESLWSDVTNFRFKRGASTLTMQVASLCYLGDHKKSLRQKWHQMIYAYAIEKQFSKEEILKTYLMVAPMSDSQSSGKVVRGFIEAGHFYYGHSLREMTYEEEWALVLTLRNSQTLTPVRTHVLLDLPETIKKALHQTMFRQSQTQKLLPRNIFGVDYVLWRSNHYYEDALKAYDGAHASK